MSDRVQQICDLKAALSPDEVNALGKRLKIWPRCLALAVIENDAGALLVDPGYDRKKDQHFYRLLGGGVDFGERSAAALVRELREELNADVSVGDLMGTLENIFTFEGVVGHEIIFVYRAAFVEPRWYKQKEIAVQDAGRAATVAVWKSIEAMQAAGAKLYPDGVAELL